MTMRLLHFVSHPIQYHAPLFRRIAAESGLDFRVIFLRDTQGGYFDAGFGRDVRWDVPLRSGYESITWEETDWKREIREADAVWFHGWQGARMVRAIGYAHDQGKSVLMRGENNDCAMPDGSGVRGWLKRRFLDFIFTRCDVFLAIGKANRGYYERRGIAPGRIVDMGYAVDNDFFAAGAAAAKPHRENLRRSLGLDGRPVVLYAGKLIPRKHPEWLLKAWGEAPWPGAKPVLLYVGDGDMRATLERHASPDVRFVGFKNQSELPALYDLADVFVLPAEREPWGLAVNESMACGAAVVVSDQVGCAPDLVDESCGAVFPCGDVIALGRALVDVLGRAEGAGAAARRKIVGWSFETNLRGLRAALDLAARSRKKS